MEGLAPGFLLLPYNTSGTQTTGPCKKTWKNPTEELLVFFHRLQPTPDRMQAFIAMSFCVDENLTAQE
jgi:hypothetical protein